ncbi:MAG: hypothetical protein ACOH5I_10210 [Oligoflexus sp.]
MQARSINQQVEPLINFDTNMRSEQTEQPAQASLAKSFWDVFSGSPKAFKIFLLTVSLVSFSSGLSLTVVTLAPDKIDLERQEVLDQQFSVVSLESEGAPFVNGSL